MTRGARHQPPERQAGDPRASSNVVSMEPQENRAQIDEGKRREVILGVATALGAALGAAIFVATGSPIWVGLGVALGVIVGAIVGFREG